MARERMIVEAPPGVGDHITGSSSGRANLGEEARLAARITALEQEIEERRRSSERLAGILDLQAELICRLRPTGVPGDDDGAAFFVTYANDSFCHYFDRRREELVGQPLDLAAPDEDRHYLNEHLGALGAGEPMAFFEHRIRRPGGELRWLSWQHHAVLSPAGEVVEIQAVGHDVTEERGLSRPHATNPRPLPGQRAVSRIPHPGGSEMRDDPLQELGRYASSVAHDFNNLLVGILGNSRLALMDLSTYSPCRPLIQEVETAAMRAAELANQMLVFTGRFIRGKTTQEPPIHHVETWRSHGNVLVVDDEEMVRSLAKRVLHKVGFKVMTVEDGARAVELFRAHASEITAVLLDMTMPGPDGEQTFYELRRIRPDIKVLLSSGYDVKDAVARLRDEGLAGFIHKPYLPEELIAHLRAIVEPGTAAG